MGQQLTWNNPSSVQKEQLTIDGVTYDALHMLPVYSSSYFKLNSTLFTIFDTDYITVEATTYKTSFGGSWRRR